MADIENNSGLKDVSKIQEGQIVGNDAPQEADDQYKGSVKCVNMLTGEAMEREYNSVTEIRQIYIELEASRKAIVTAQNKLKYLLEQFMTQYDEYAFPDGAIVKWVNPTQTKIDFASVAAELGADEAALFSTVSITQLKEYLKECVKRGEMTYEEQDRVLSKAYTVPGKAYLKIGV